MPGPSGCRVGPRPSTQATRERPTMTTKLHAGASYFLSGVMQGKKADGEGIAGTVPQDYRREMKDAILAVDHGAAIIEPWDLVGAEVQKIYRDGTPQSAMFEADADVKHCFEVCVDAAAHADVVVSFLPEASMGSAVEIYAAKQAGKPVLVIAPGTMAQNWVVRSYADRVFPSIDALQTWLASQNAADRAAPTARVHHDSLATYARVWALQRLVDMTLGGNQTLSVEATNAYLEALLFAILLAIVGVTGSVRAQLGTALCIAAVTFVKAPYVWDCDYWLLLTDLSLLVLFLAHRRSASKSLRLEPSAGERASLFAAASSLIQEQMGLLYVAAGFWKLNSSFLSPRHSCAPVFLLQLFADILTPRGLELPAVLASALGQMAPLMVLVGELSLGVLLLLPSRTLNRLGVALALLFHTAVAVCPPPNNVAIFSMLCASRLVLALPCGFDAAATELKALVGGAGARRSPPLVARLYYAAAAVAVAIAAALADHREALAFFDWGLPLFVALGAFVCRAVFLDGEGATSMPTAAETLPLWRLRFGIRSLTLFYAFGAIVLGVHDQGQPHMYANLRLHGGSNHYLMPTGLLQTLFEGADPRSPLGDFSGGVVRIEQTTSPSLNAAYPAEYTTQFSSRTRQLLMQAGHTGRMWNPMLTLITSCEAPWDPKGGTPFVKYTLPALELRRFVHELRRKGEAFELTYTRLHKATDARTRVSSAQGTTITLREDGKGGRSCTVISGGGLVGGVAAAIGLGKPCDADELVLLPPPSAIARKLLLFEPYPIVEGDEEEVHCFGP
ncbi:Hypothetical protein EMIHUDRAFT_115140 [Emiliania huxleyi CCMP1516]|uniref:HTTM domain-containing protein n=2 Tax=Emiliania huxleyi TaxID=2903 RepID=A0A0D3JRS6_EMIH1|nr:Hypothetical protein EMIHUDRAFT_115140 [Emiliania huxleyi CCMP1516]EOD26211.1 Hypothetical protein EMIHUDRAFT_115140 [Emiliania huxleyi CCMP1516]|eukprot:XP_005778640.1 Hypothetical protein EMIHUDRAFT_115140 [Emiliania huxleyi CCMP1516]